MRYNLYYFSPSFVPWCGRPSSSPSLPLLVVEPLSPLGALVVAGYYWKKKKERKLASLGAWLVFWFFSLVKFSFVAEPCLEEKKVGGGFSSWKIVAHTMSEVRRGIR